MCIRKLLKCYHIGSVLSSSQLAASTTNAASNATSNAKQSQTESQTASEKEQALRLSQILAKASVKEVDLDLYEGQLFSLLGHNGAGKTTLISMLTGLYPPTSGDALVYGHSIVSNMSQVRASLGICPQHDVVVPFLTPAEILSIVATLKGVPSHSLQVHVTDMLRDVGLMEKQHELTKNLSGGQKRKLSVAMAFIGGSKVILLDEPTSGMIVRHCE